MNGCIWDKLVVGLPGFAKGGIKKEVLVSENRGCIVIIRDIDHRLPDFSGRNLEKETVRKGEKVG